MLKECQGKIRFTGETQRNAYVPEQPVTLEGLTLEEHLELAAAAFRYRRRGRNPAEMNGNSEGWIHRELRLPDDAKYLRFRYHTDEYINGRGWSEKDPRVIDAHERRMNVKWSGAGWELRNR